MKKQINRFCKEAKMLITDNENPDKIVFNASKMAKSHLTQVIAAAKGEQVKAEIAVETASDKLHLATFGTGWFENPEAQLDAIDAAENDLKTAKKHLKNLEHTIKKRQALLDRYEAMVSGEEV